MTVFFSNCYEWIKKHFQQEKFNNFSIVVILLYYYVGLLSYVTVPIKHVYHYFTSGSGFAVVLRALLTALVIIYSLLAVVINKRKIQWKWAIVFIYVLLFTLISVLISPQTYHYIYIESLYRVVHQVEASPGFKRLFILFLSSISDFGLAFCFVFILPIVLNNKKQILILSIPIVLICLGECVYSLVVERQEYIKLFNYVDPQYGGYNVVIGASFGNKQDWGAFTTVSFSCAIITFALIDGKNLKTILIKTLLLLSSFIIFIFTIASLCKTAIFSQLFVIIYLLSLLFKKRHYFVFVLLSLFMFGFLLSIYLFYKIPSFHSSGWAEKIYNVTYNYIIAKIKSGATSGRTFIWMNLINSFRTYNLFFGLSKGGVSTYSQVAMVEGQSQLHNGIIYFFASYGILGLSIYLILLFIVIKRIMMIWTINSSLVFIFVGLFGAAMIFSLVEAEVLIVSGANPIFIFNILLCVFPQGLILEGIKEKGLLSNV